MRLHPLSLLLAAALLFSVAQPSSAVLATEDVYDFQLGIKFPSGSLILASDGFFYGVASQGNFGPGVIFKISMAGETTTLARFTGTAGSLPGSRPVGPLTLGSDGNLYGVTTAGGASDFGTVFKVVPGSGSVTSVGAFTGANGATPVTQQGGSALIPGADGALYGATNAGGSADLGTLFKVTPTGGISLVAEFTGSTGSLAGAQPRLPFLGGDGKLYGVTRFGGPAGVGTVYRIESSGVATSLASFTGISGALPGSNPNTLFVQALDGLYGTTVAGAPGDFGTIFKITLGGAVVSVASFTGTSGALAGAAPRVPNLGPDGAVYGTTLTGGTGNVGTVFRAVPGGAATSLGSFTGFGGAIPGATPLADLAVSTNGNLYGVTNAGGTIGAGTVFQVNPGTGSVNMVAFFTGPGGALPGQLPTANFIRGSDGALYSSTTAGGLSLGGGGTIFRIGTNGAVTTQGAFTNGVGSTLGQGPSAKMVLGSDGALYGTTIGGGRATYGTFYKVVPGAGLVTLTSFSGEFGSPAGVGSFPRALATGGGGHLYGVNFSGGAAGAGTVFRQQPGGELTVLASFTGADGVLPGQNPMSLTRGDDGNFYGVTLNGGSSELGTVFKVSPVNSSVQLVASFTGTGGALAGANPAFPLTRGSDGNLYGITLNGGSTAQVQGGTIFKVVPGGAVTYLATIGSLSASLPSGPLVAAADGNLYGCTNSGGSANNGVLFRIVPNGSIAAVASFTGSSGALPGSGSKVLSPSPDGFLFGATIGGGSTGAGTIFRLSLLNPGEVPTTIATFTGVTGTLPGAGPNAPMTVASDGALYGMTSNGGANNRGVVYKVTQTGATTLASFPATNILGLSQATVTPFVAGRDGNLYGTLPTGGAVSAGSVISIVPGAGTVSTIASFTGIEGALPGRGPNTPLVVGPDGNLYGTTLENGPFGGGTIYHLNFDSGTQTAPTILSASATSATPTSAQFTAVVMPNGSATAVTFEFGPDPLPFSGSTAPVSIPATAGATQVTATVTNLTPHTRYRFRAVASNAGGSTVGSNATVVTSNTLPMPVNDTIHPPGIFGTFTCNVLSNDTDPDGDKLTIASVGNGAKGTVAISDSILTYTPTGPGYDGNDSFTYTVSDGFGGTAQATVTLVNAGPVANAQIIGASEDIPKAIILSASDADGDGILFSDTAPSHGTLSGTAPNLTYTPTANFFGSDSFTFTANDNHGRLAQATITINVAPVNDHPVAVANQYHVTLPGPFILDALSNDSDVDGDRLSIAAVGQGTNGAVTTDGARVTYVPGINYTGSDTFTYTVSDGAGGVTQGMVTLVNSQPVLGKQAFSTAEDIATQIVLTGTDADGDTLSYSIVTGPTRGTLSGSAPALVYTPAADLNGPDSFIFSVSDGHGGLAQATATITVLPVNDVPIATGDTIHPPAATGAFSIPVLSNDRDVDVDTVLSITSVTDGRNGAVSINGGNVVYTPGPSYTGNDSFNYTINDGAGATDTASVLLVNEPPIARPDVYHPPAGSGPHVFPVLSNDTDADPEDELLVVAVTDGTSGTVTISDDAHSVRYTPGIGYTGNDICSYTVTDQRGGKATTTVTLRNTPPVATNETFHPAVTGEVLTFSVLGNDTDSDAQDNLVVISVSAAFNGAVTTDGQRLFYTPGPHFDGNDAFSYTASDAHGGTSTATVTLNNALPSAEPDIATTRRESVQIPVLANDSDADVDDTLRVVDVNDGAKGTATTDGTQIVYTPGADFRSGDAFTYTVSDGRGGTATGTVTILLADVVKEQSSATEGGEVPGEPEGTVFKRFGVPSINEDGHLAFQATMSTPGDTEVKSAVFAGSPPHIVARKGDVAAGVPKGVFRSFKDPVLNGSDQVAFLGMVTGVPKNSGEGLWLGNAGAAIGLTGLTLIAREGSEAAGAAGAKFSAFLSIALPDNGRVVFVATLAEGGGGVTTKDNLGVWAQKADGSLALLVRKGQTLEFGGGPHIVKTPALLTTVAGSPGQRRSFNSDGDLLMRVSFTDGADALVAVQASGELQAVALDGDALTNDGGVQLSAFGIPSLDAGGNAAFSASLKRGVGGVSAGNDRAIISAGADSETPRVLARTGDPATGVSGAVFASFSDPLLAPTGEISFMAKLKIGIGGVTAASDSGIWENRSGELALVAREGGEAPGVIGAKFEAFSSLALPSRRGVAFVARLAPQKGVVTPANDIGLWAKDRDGILRLLVREGDTLEISGQNKELRSFTILTAVSGSAGQGHSSSTNGGFVYRATFTDGSQALQTIWVP